MYIIFLLLCNKNDIFPWIKWSQVMMQLVKCNEKMGLLPQTLLIKLFEAYVFSDCLNIRFNFQTSNIHNRLIWEMRKL